MAELSAPAVHCVELLGM